MYYFVWKYSSEQWAVSTVDNDEATVMSLYTYVFSCLSWKMQTVLWCFILLNGYIVILGTHMIF